MAAPLPPAAALITSLTAPGVAAGLAAGTAAAAAVFASAAAARGGAMSVARQAAEAARSAAMREARRVGASLDAVRTAGEAAYMKSSLDHIWEILRDMRQRAEEHVFAPPGGEQELLDTFWEDIEALIDSIADEDHKRIVLELMDDPDRADEILEEVVKINEIYEAKPDYEEIIEGLEDSWDAEFQPPQGSIESNEEGADETPSARGGADTPLGRGGGASSLARGGVRGGVFHAGGDAPPYAAFSARYTQGGLRSPMPPTPVQMLEVQRARGGGIRSSYESSYQYSDTSRLLVGVGGAIAGGAIATVGVVLVFKRGRRRRSVQSAGGARPGFRRRPEALRSVVPGSAENET